MENVKIFDTTLRDGQQSPGAGMSIEDNIIYAMMAADLGVDVLEAGFPAASEDEAERVKKIAEAYAEREYSPIVTGLCQLREAQVDATIQALEPAINVERWRVHTYFPVDPELMEASMPADLRKEDGTPDYKKIEEEVYRLCKKASDAGADVEFSLEWYSKIWDNFDFGTALIDAAYRWGAKTINCPDTIWGAHPWQGDEYYVEKMKIHKKLMSDRYDNINIIWSVHCHNDLGKAVDNSTNGVIDGGARQIECSVNGVWERAGNCSLQEVVTQIFLYGEKVGLYTNINMEHLQAISDFVAKKMLPLQPNSPVTWKNAARHTSGGHANALIKNPTVYQPFNPKNVGKKGIELVFGPSSGGNHAKEIIEKYGYVCANHEKSDIAQFIKEYYKGRYKWVTDEEVVDAYFEYRYENTEAPVDVTKINFSRDNGKATVELFGKFFDMTDICQTIEWEDGAFTAVKKLFDKMMPGYTVEDYVQNADGKTTEAKAVSVVIITDGKKNFTWNSKDSDINRSAIRALIEAYNRAWIEENSVK